MIASLRNSFFALLLLLLPAAAQVASAPPAVSINAGVDRSDITVGDLINFTVTVKHDANVKVSIPPIGEKLGEFLIRDISTPDTKSENGMLVDEVTYKITTYFTGDLSVPAVEIAYAYTDANGEETAETVSTEPLEINVRRVSPENATDIRDIKGPVDIPVSPRYYIFWGGTALIIIAVLAASFLYWKRWRRRDEKAELMTPPTPAHELALQRLKQIEEMELIAEGRFREFYELITAVLREYLGARYTLEALEMTTSELIRNLAGSLREMDLRNKVASVLEEGDMVKFAKLEPEKNNAAAALVETRTVIERSIPWIFKQKQGTGMTENQNGDYIGEDRA